MLIVRKDGDPCLFASAHPQGIEKSTFSHSAKYELAAFNSWLELVLNFKFSSKQIWDEQYNKLIICPQKLEQVDVSQTFQVHAFIKREIFKCFVAGTKLCHVISIVQHIIYYTKNTMKY